MDALYIITGLMFVAAGWYAGRNTDNPRAGRILRRGLISVGIAIVAVYYALKLTGFPYTGIWLAIAMVFTGSVLVALIGWLALRKGASK